MKKRYILSTILISLLVFIAIRSGFTSPAEAKETGSGVNTGIIMYHNISKNNNLHGKFTISPGEFESDLKYLKENGFNTVVMADLLAFVYGNVPLPSNPVMLTFDDGEFGVYYYAYPLLKQYGMKAVFSIIGNVTDIYTNDTRKDVVFPHITWKQVNEMLESGCCEFANHSYGLHSDNKACSGIAMKKRESMDDYKKRVRGDLSLMQSRMEEVTGKKNVTFTYPYGKLTAASEQILRELDFKASISCLEGVNKLAYGNYDCLFKLRRYNRPHNTGIAKVLKRIARETV